MTILGTDPSARMESEENHYLWSLLIQAWRSIWRLSEREMSQHGITPEQAGVLFLILNIERPATPTELSRWLLTAQNTVSGLLARMEEKGLIERVNDLDKRNEVRAVITEKGKQVYRRAEKREFLTEIMSVLSDEDRSHLAHSLLKLRAKAVEMLGIDSDTPFPRGRSADAPHGKEPSR